VTIPELDGLLLRWLHAAYLHISSLPAFSNKNKLPLSTLVAVGNLLSPFVSRSEKTGENQMPLLEIGFPTTEELAHNTSELVRLAGAAIVAYNEYLSRPTQPGAIPMDEASLLFATIAIRSMSVEENMKTFEEQMKEARATMKVNIPPEGDKADLSDALSAATLNSDASSFDRFGVEEIRFLMHWIRAELSLYFADVNYILGNPKGHQAHMSIAQTDRLCLLKLCPTNLAAYVLYSRSCLQFQQMKAAFIFSLKGITVAQKLTDDAHLAQLLLINATSAALGSSGEMFSYTGVMKSYNDAIEARDKTLSWLPTSYHELLELEPELTIVSTRVISALSEQALTAGVEGEVMLPSLKSHYGTKEPSQVPPGAVEEDGEGGVKLRPTGFDVIEEGDEQEGKVPVPASQPAGNNNNNAHKKPLGKGQRTQRKR
jgi:hypothetical protein